MKYHNFDIRINSINKGTYFVKARSAEGDTATAELNVNGILKEFLELISNLGGRQPLESLGSNLHAALFQDEIASLMAKTQRRVRPPDKIRLRLDFSEAISLMPWECLYDRNKERFLTLSNTSLIRFVESEKPITELKIDLPLKVLLVIAGPEGQERTARSLILKTFAQFNHEMVEYTLLEGRPTAQAIRTRLSNERYHVLHLVASSGRAPDHDYILLDAGGSTPERVLVRQLTQIVKECRNLKLLILDCPATSEPKACGLAAIGQQLVGSGVTAAIVMQFPMAEPASFEFTKDFYTQITEGEEPGRLDAAVTHARNSIVKISTDAPDFAAPALITRSPNGVIFYFDARKPPRSSRSAVAGRSEKSGRLSRRARSIRKGFLRDIRTAHQRNITLLSKEAKHGDNELKERLNTEISEERLRVIDLEDKLWRWGKTLLLAFLFSLVMLFASEVNFLNKFWDFDDRVTNKIIDYANERMKPGLIPGRLALITLDQPAQPNGDEITATRKTLATLIPILSGAKASVLAIDVGFNKPSLGDKALAAAIGEAQSNHTLTVLFSTRDVKGDGSPTKAPPSDLQDSLAGKYGLVELDAPADDKQHHIVRRAVLGKYVGAQEPDDTQQEIPLYPSLALQAVINQRFPQRTVQKVFYDLDHSTIRVGDVNSHDGAMRIPASNPLFDKNKTARYRAFYFIHYVVENSLEEESHSAQTIIERQNDKTTLDAFKDRIVFLTIPKKGEADTFDTPRGQRRGTDILLNVASNLLSNEFITRQSLVSRYLVIVLMVAVGLLLHARFARAWRFKVKVNLKFLVDPVQIPFILAIVGFAYLAVIESYYEHYLVICDLAYPLIALVASYGLLALTRALVIRKWS
ncbi:MAG TPA: CHASE2 domain-containing protein [Pyrinomonadaceae bacterium]|nr:CHASE2 domain-containing protein [Pyrinomonadaceae bacterium]